MEDEHAGGYRVGELVLDLASNRVFAGETPIRLNWKPFQALCILAEARGGVVTRDELFRRLWQDADVDESSLAKCISQLRKALASGHPGEEYLETIPRVGYRLAVPVEPLEEVAHPAAMRGRRFVWLAAGLAAALAVGVFGWNWRQDQSRLREYQAAIDKGTELLRKPGNEGAGEAMPYLERAIELNPRSAIAYSTLAHAMDRLSPLGHEDAPVGRTTPLEAAERAVTLDPNCGACQGTLGMYLFYHAWKWNAAEQHYLRALELAPGDYGIRPSYAMLLGATGRLQEALEQVDQGLAGRPYNLVWQSIRVRILYSMRRFPEALETADHILSIDRGAAGGWEWRSRALFQMGRSDEAVQALASSPLWSEHAAELETAFRRGGSEAALRALLQITSGWNATAESSRRAAWKALLGDGPGALDELETAKRSHNLGLIWVGVDPVYDFLREEPRFQRILEEMNLAPLLTSRLAAR